MFFCLTSHDPDTPSYHQELDRVEVTMVRPRKGSAVSTTSSIPDDEQVRLLAAGPDDQNSLF